MSEEVEEPREEPGGKKAPQEKGQVCFRCVWAELENAAKSSQASGSHTDIIGGTAGRHQKNHVTEMIKVEARFS